MAMKVKNLFLHFSKAIGMFTLSTRFHHRSLQILCYHGLSFEDEHIFSPGSFMTQDTFARRLAYLRDNGFKVLGLTKAIERLRTNNLEPKSVVITVDDGFYSFYKLGVPLLKEYDYPSTLYVTSYYVKHPNPIFRLVMQYMFWKSEHQSISLYDLLPDLTNPCPIKGTSGNNNLWKLIEHAENKLNEEEQNKFLEEIANRLNVDYGKIRNKRLFSLVKTSEIKAMQSDGVDIQLHTHRHRMPDDPVKAKYEIKKNREVLTPFVTSPLVHLCYPSGIWSKKHWSVFEGLQIESATTCDPGLNKSNTHLLALRRYVDQENFSNIAFEAELSCFKEVLRNIRCRLRI